MWKVWRLAAIAVLCAGASLPVRGQVATRIDLDNDSFNFWQAPKRRADREYSQGTRINLLWPTANTAARRLLGGPQHCHAPAAERDCRLMSFGLVQAIFTPTLDLRYRSLDERPFAGWLGLEFGAQRDKDRSLRAYSLMLGVTGPASLAAPAQKWVHRNFGFRPPVGWERQLPTELAIVAAYRGAREFGRFEDASTGLRMHLAPVWAARLGTVATDATLGLQVTAGLRPPRPWQAPNHRGDRWGAFVRAGAAQSAVLRNLFLDGSTFNSQSLRVTRNVWLSELELGAGLRSPIGLLEWRLHRRGKEYQFQPKAHAYSTVSFSLR